MSLIVYNRGIPNEPNDPSQDQPIMKRNTNSIDDWTSLSGDHFGFNVSLGGYHRYIHQPPQTAPVSIAAIGQTYVKTVGSDVQLFYKSGAGVETQLTGPNAALAAANGYTWLPGKILMQWGINNLAVPSTTSSNFTQNFNIPFPNNCFYISGSGLYSSSNKPHSQISIGIRKSSLTNLTNFDYLPYTGSSDYIGFLWTAIGN